MSTAMSGQRALILGLANANSIAYGVAKALKAQGVELAITYQTERTRDFIAPLLDELEPAILEKCNVQEPGELEAVFSKIRQQWGQLDMAVHSIAFALKDDLHGRVVDSSAEGFALAMDVSCHSFIRMCKLAEPLMHEGGTLLTMSYLGAERVVPNYGVMGPVKAALEASVKYLANELGPKKIRVHAVSPGPIMTRAASGIPEFNAMLAQAAQQAPMRELVDIDDVGAAAVFLCSDGAKRLTGSTFYIDGGVNIMG
ncbi:enoyl-ACP reductase FabI [Chitinibacter tainanensis]|uniref:enoyl-ACP reductase FabI n=1 Tax=Chitinibacter tainanensis TaxID=230667 RepID=UPI000419386F|nr:enoyl-ACP reductase FabI [Chitinibacter tainanensis]